PPLGREHRRRGRACCRDHAAAGRPGRILAGAAVGTLGTERRRRDLPDLSRPADAAVPAALARDLEARSAGPPLVAGARLSVVHDPVRDVAAHGLLSNDPGRTRGCSARRRLLAAKGAGPGDLSDLDSRDPDRGHLLVLALRE